MFFVVFQGKKISGKGGGPLQDRPPFALSVQKRHVFAQKEVWKVTVPTISTKNTVVGFITSFLSDDDNPL